MAQKHNEMADLISHYSEQLIIKGFWDESIYLHNLILEADNKVERRFHGFAYNNIGSIYYNKGDWDRALEYYLKSEKIIIEVGYRAGLGPTYFNIGTGYQQKGEHEKGAEYIIVASFIAMAMGMRHELSQMSWAIEPILNELGQEHFMEIGKRLYQQRLG